MKEEHKKKRMKLNKLLLKAWPVVLMVLLMSITYQFYKSLKTQEESELYSEFHQYTKEYQTLIEERILAYEQLLYGIKGLFEASEDVKRSEFKTYIETIHLSEIFPEIQSVGYSKAVLPEDREQFINSLKDEGFRSFDIRPDDKRDFYTSILYLEPFDDSHQKAFGYDMYSEPTRSAAMQQARDKSLPTISGKVTLLEEHESSDSQTGFLMYLPIFKKNSLHETIEERKANIQGWIYAPFKMKEFMLGLQAYSDKYFDIEIYDNTDLSQDSLMYDSIKNNPNPLFTNMMELDVGGRIWTIIIKSTPIYDANLDLSKATYVLIAGFIFNLFVVFNIIQLISKNEKIELKAIEVNKELHLQRQKLYDLNRTLEKRVDQKTKELQISNKQLEEHLEELYFLNMQLRKAKEEALQATQARSNFISSISHELRTPLNSIINFTDQVIEDFDEMLEDKELQKDTQHYLTRVLVNSKHLLDLINDLLDFTKAEAGKIEYHIEEVEINNILIMGYKNTHSLLNGSDVKFKVSLAEEPLFAMVDSRRFLQIILNLLSNAIKFTKKGSIEIKSYKEENHIVVKIKDTGKGIPEERQKVIFEPFMQANSKDAGTGLGLGLAKRMCDDMNIDLGFTSIEGVGTTFRLVLKG